MEAQIPTTNQPKSEPDEKDADRRAATASGDDAQDLGRVREILFGSSLRQIEERLRSLEADLQGKLNSARERAKKESDAFESRVKELLASLKKELNSEKEARTRAVEELSRTLTRSLNEIEERVIEITDEIDDEKVSRSDLAQMFTRVSSELKNAGGAGEKSGSPDARPDPGEGGLPGFTPAKK